MMIHWPYGIDMPVVIPIDDDLVIGIIDTLLFGDI